MKIYWDIKAERHRPNDMDGPIWQEGYYHFEPNDYFGVEYKERQPKWYRDLTPWEGGFRRQIDFVKEYWERIMESRSATSFKTAKTCPAFINFFKQSIALKTPADIFIEIYQNKETQEWEFKWKTTDNFWTLSGHADAQVGAISQGSMVLKFSHELMWMADQDCQFQYVDPFIQNMVHYRVCPGIIHLKKGSIGSFNMPVFFAKTEGKYLIPQGSTIAYVQFDKPVRKMIHKDMTKQLKTAWYKIFTKGDHSEHIGK